MPNTESARPFSMRYAVVKVRFKATMVRRGSLVHKADKVASSFLNHLLQGQKCTTQMKKLLDIDHGS